MWVPEMSLTLHFIYWDRCLNPELIIPGSLASHLVHWISHLYVSGTGLQVSCHTHLILHSFEGLTLLTRALPLSRLLSPDLNIEIHFWAFLQALLSLSPKWSIWMLFVSELSCLTGNSFPQLDMKSILRSEFCTKWKGIWLYLIKLFDHVIVASYIPKNFPLTREGTTQLFVVFFEWDLVRNLG